MISLFPSDIIKLIFSFLTLRECYRCRRLNAELQSKIDTLLLNKEIHLSFWDYALFPSPPKRKRYTFLPPYLIKESLQEEVKRMQEGSVIFTTLGGKVLLQLDRIIDLFNITTRRVIIEIRRIENPVIYSMLPTNSNNRSTITTTRKLTIRHSNNTITMNFVVHY